MVRLRIAFDPVNRIKGDTLWHRRDALYMPALVIMRFNPDRKAICDKLRGAGKPAKVALTAGIGKTVPQTVFGSSADAKTHQTRKCPRQSGSDLGAKRDLTKTDTPNAEFVAHAKELGCDMQLSLMEELDGARLKTGT